MTGRTPQHASIGSEWLSVGQCAKELGVSDTTIHALIRDGKIVAADVSTGRKSNFRIRREDWDRYLEAAVKKVSTRFGGAS